MAAERVLTEDQPDEGFAVTTEAVVVDGEDVQEVDPRFLYRAVGVAALDANPLTSKFASGGAEAKCAASGSKAARARVLRDHVGKAPSRKKLTGRVVDFGFLVRAKRALAKTDFAACCAAAAARRDDPAALVPENVAAAVVARLAALSGGGEEE